MKTIKRLFTLLILGAIAYGALWIYEGPLYALYEIKQGLDARDVVRVERYVDLEAVVKASVDVIAAMGKEQLGIDGKGTDLGSRIGSSILGAITGAVGEAASVQGAMELRHAIQEGRVKPQIGPFVVKDGWSAVSDVEFHGDVALVTLAGTCNGKEASVRVLFQRKDTPGFLGRPRKSVLTGVDSASIPDLAKACR
jgi:hypothetical protein